jgi:hypothetical protein
MKKVLIASVALVALSGAALADSRHGSYNNSGNPFSNSGTTSVEGSIDVTKTRTTTHTTVNKDAFDNYSGIGTYTSAEHGGISNIKTTGKAGAASLGVNAATASANGVQGSIDLGASVNGAIGGLGSAIGSLNAGLGATALQAGTSAVSGSGLVAGASNGGSLKAESAGYASGSAVAQREWGNSHTYSTQDQWNTTRTLSAQGSLSRTR